MNYLITVSALGNLGKKGDLIPESAIPSEQIERLTRMGSLIAQPDGSDTPAPAPAEDKAADEAMKLEELNALVKEAKLLGIDPIPQTVNGIKQAIANAHELGRQLMIDAATRAAGVTAVIKPLTPEQIEEIRLANDSKAEVAKLDALEAKFGDSEDASDSEAEEVAKVEVVEVVASEKIAEPAIVTVAGQGLTELEIRRAAAEKKAAEKEVADAAKAAKKAAEKPKKEATSGD